MNSLKNNINLGLTHLKLKFLNTLTSIHSIFISKNQSYPSMEKLAWISITDLSLIAFKWK